MTSLLCNRQSGGFVEVYDKDVVEQLAIDSNDHIQTMYVPRSQLRSRSNGKRPTSTPNPRHSLPQSTRSMDPDALIDHNLKLQRWLNQKSVHAVQEKTDLEAKKTKKLYEPVLETEDTFVKDMESAVSHKEMLNLRKKEMLHRKWNEQVYEPIRMQIDKEMTSPMYEELSRRKRELHKEYLEHTNRKGHVFLDTYAPDEYYAMSLHPTRPSLITAQTRQLRDPLISQERDRCEDDRILFRCMTGSKLRDRDIQQIRLPPLPLVPLGRHGTDCTTWLAMPMGDIESPARYDSRRRMWPQSNHSQFTFEDWGAPADQTLVDAELAIQKRRPGNPDMFDLQPESPPVETMATEPASPPAGATVQCQA